MFVTRGIPFVRYFRVIIQFYSFIHSIGVGFYQVDGLLYIIIMIGYWGFVVKYTVCDDRAIVAYIMMWQW